NFLESRMVIRLSFDRLDIHDRRTSLHRPGVDLFVILMRSNEPHVNAFAAIMNSGHQPVLVAADVEYHSAAREDIGAVEHRLDVRRLRPVSRFDDCHPCPQWLLGVRSPRATPKLPQDAHSDYAHGSI